MLFGVPTLRASPKKSRSQGLKPPFRLSLAVRAKARTYLRYKDISTQDAAVPSAVALREKSM
jgi:hypothetical protein